MKRIKKHISSGAKKALHKIKRFFRGFTIIELIVVISIIGVLASVVLVSVSSYIGKSRDSRIKGEISEIAKEATTYYVDNFSYSGYSISDSFVPVSSGSDYVFLTDGTSAYVVYAKLATSDNYWCTDSTGTVKQIENPPDSEVYVCTSGAGVGSSGEDLLLCGETICGVGEICSQDGYGYPACISCNEDSVCDFIEDCRCSDCPCSSNCCPLNGEVYVCTVHCPPSP